MKETEGKLGKKDRSSNPRRRSFARFIVISIAAIAVLSASAVAYFSLVGDQAEQAASSKDDGVPKHCKEPTDHKSTATQASEPSTGGIELKEEGVTVRNDPDLDYLSFGALVENTSDLVASDVTLSFSPLDSSGEFGFISSRFEEKPMSVTIPYLYPGQEFGVGQWMDGLADPDTIDELEMKLDSKVSQWWNPGERFRKFAAIDAKSQGAVSIDESRKIGPFTMVSDFCEDVPVKASMLYRDTGGHIVGGRNERNMDAPSVDTLKNLKPGSTDDVYVWDHWPQQLEERYGVKIDIAASRAFPYFST